MPQVESEAGAVGLGTADIRTLIVAAQAGDRRAFSALIKDHYDLIYRAAYKWSGARADAEDIAQEVCVKLATAIRSFDGRSAFTTWLYRVTLNTVRDLQRARGRRLRQAQALLTVTPEDRPADQEDEVATRELWRAVRQLPEKQRDAVLLVYAEELSHAAAAAIMGCKEATVSWHVFEAKRALRGLL